MNKDKIMDIVNFKDFIRGHFKTIPLKDNSKLPAIKGWQDYIDKPIKPITSMNYGILMGQYVDGYGYLFGFDVDCYLLKDTVESVNKRIGKAKTTQEKQELEKYLIRIKKLTQEDKKIIANKIFELVKKEYKDLDILAIVQTASGGFHILFFTKHELDINKYCKTEIEIFNNDSIGKVKIGIFQKGKQIVGVGSIIKNNDIKSIKDNVSKGKEYKLIEYNPNAKANDNNLECFKKFLRSENYKTRSKNQETSNDILEIEIEDVDITNYINAFKKHCSYGRGESNDGILKIIRNLYAHKIINTSQTHSKRLSIVYNTCRACDTGSDFFKQGTSEIIKQLEGKLNNFFDNIGLLKHIDFKKNVVNINRFPEGTKTIDKRYFEVEDLLPIIKDNIATLLIGTTGTGKNTACVNFYKELNKDVEKQADADWSKNVIKVDNVNDFLMNDDNKTWHTIYLTNLRRLADKNGIFFDNNNTLKKLAKKLIFKDIGLNKNVLLVLDELKEMIKTLMLKNNNYILTKEQALILDYIKELIDMHNEGFINLRIIGMDVNYEPEFYKFFKEMMGIDYQVIHNKHKKSSKKNFYGLTNRESFYNQINISVFHNEPLAIFTGTKKESYALKDYIELAQKINNNKDKLPIYIINGDEKELPPEIEKQDGKFILIYTASLSHGFSIINKYIKKVFVMDTYNMIDTSTLHNSIFRVRDWVDKDGNQYGIKEIYYYSNIHIIKDFTNSKQQRDDYLDNFKLERIAKKDYYNLHNELEKNLKNDVLYRHAFLKERLKKENISYKNSLTFDDDNFSKGLHAFKKLQAKKKNLEILQEVKETDVDNITNEEELKANNFYHIVKGYGNDVELINEEFKKVEEKKTNINKYTKNEIKKSYGYELHFKEVKDLNKTEIRQKEIQNNLLKMMGKKDYKVIINKQVDIKKIQENVSILKQDKQEVQEKIKENHKTK